MSGRSRTTRRSRPSPRRWSPDTAASTPRRSTATRRARARPSPPPASPRGTLRHHQALEQRPGYDSTLRAFDTSLEKLGLDYLDLYLIHWPLPSRGKYIDTYKAFEKLYTDGRIKAIGVSNFYPEYLEQLIEATSVIPAVNQIELHPHLQQHATREYHAQQGIATEAWSPLGSGKGLLEVPAIVAIAQKHNRTPAQIVLRWHIQLGNVVIPKSVTPSRIKENIDVFDFSLDTEDIAAISALNEDRRLGPDPATFDMG